MRLDMMPPEYRARFVAKPYEFVLEPFCVEGNLYFIGNKEIGCYLIDTGDGLIVLDTGYESCSGQFFSSIYELGFRPQQVKMIFHTHMHQDHIGSTNLLVQYSGAKTYMSAVDAEILRTAEPGPMNPIQLRFTPDVLTKDGDRFTLGNTTILVKDTPGHTRGNQSFFFNVQGSDEKEYIAGLHGGLGINTLHREFMERTGYYEAKEDYFGQIERMRELHVDIFLGSHSLQNYTLEKLERRKQNPDGPNPFIDPQEWPTILQIAWEMSHELVRQEESGDVPEWQRQGYSDLNK